MGSFKKRFSALVVLSTIGYVLSFCNQLVISYYFGTSSMLDAYWAALAIANFLCFYLHPLKEAIVPAAYRSSRISMEEASDMLSAGITFLGLLVGISTAVMFFSPGFLVDWFTNSDSSNQQLLKLLPWFIPFLFLFSFSEMLSSVLLGFNKNVTQATARLVASIASLVTLILLSQQLGVKALVVSLLVNQLVVILLSIWSLSGLQIKLKLASVNILKKQHVFTLFSSLFFSYLVAQLYILVERNVMMQFSTGLLSSYQYSTTLVNVMLSILAFPMSNLVWHKLLEAHNKNNTVDAQSILFKASSMLILLLVPICVFSYLNAQVIIFWIYSRGAFDHQSLLITTEAFKATIFTAIPIAVSTMIVKYFISIKKPKYVTMIGITTSVIGVVVIFVSIVLNSTKLLMWHWFLANFMGLFICLFLNLKTLKLEFKVLVQRSFLLMHFLFVVFFAAYLIAIFNDIPDTKLGAVFYLFLKLLIFIALIGLFAKLSGLFPKVNNLMVKEVHSTSI